MKKLIITLPLFAIAATGLTGCNNAKTIRVGATPSPHAEILNSSAVKDYIKSQGYKLKVVEYTDYKLPNKALNDGGIDANYFQHIPYLEDEVANYGYKISAVAKIHYEPLNLYGVAPTTYANTTINIINDITNLGRALELLKANSIIDSYDLDNFDVSHPSAAYTSSQNVTIKCIDAGLLARKVDEGGLSVIPGNYALTAWGSAKATENRILGETEEVAGQKANIIAVQNSEKESQKTKVLCDALAQQSVADFIQDSYGPTVVYSYHKL